eukprot:Lankesteria_metandrocarpae@DN5136_c0_g1_i1.p1
MSLVDYEFDSDNEEAGLLLNAAATNSAAANAKASSSTAGYTDDDDTPNTSVVVVGVYSSSPTTTVQLLSAVPIGSGTMDHSHGSSSSPSHNIDHHAGNKQAVSVTGGIHYMTNKPSRQRLSDSDASTPSPEQLLSNGNRSGELLPTPVNYNTGGDNNSTNIIKIDSCLNIGVNSLPDYNGPGDAVVSSSSIRSTGRFNDEWALESAAQLNEVKSSILPRSRNHTGADTTGTGNSNNMSSWSNSSVLAGFRDDSASQYIDGSDHGAGTGAGGNLGMKSSDVVDSSCGTRAELENRLLNKLSIVDQDDESALCRALCNPYLMETVMKRYGVEPHTTHFKGIFANGTRIAQERGDFDQFLLGSLGKSLRHKQQGRSTRVADTGTGSESAEQRKRVRRSKWDDPIPSRFSEVIVDNNTADGMHNGTINIASNSKNSNGSAVLGSSYTEGSSTFTGGKLSSTNTASTGIVDGTDTASNILMTVYENNKKWLPTSGDTSSTDHNEASTSTARGFGPQAYRRRDVVGGNGEVPYRDRSPVDDSSDDLANTARRTGGRTGGRTGERTAGTTSSNSGGRSNFSRRSPPSNSTQGGPCTGASAGADISPPVHQHVSSTGTNSKNGHHHAGSSRRRSSWDRGGSEYRYEAGRGRERNGSSRSSRYRDDSGSSSRTDHHNYNYRHADVDDDQYHRSTGGTSRQDDTAHDSSWRHSSSTGSSSSRRRVPRFSPPFEPARRRRPGGVATTAGGRRAAGGG